MSPDSFMLERDAVTRPYTFDVAAFIVVDAYNNERTLYFNAAFCLFIENDKHVITKQIA